MYNYKKNIFLFLLILPLHFLFSQSVDEVFDDTQVAIVEISVSEQALLWMYQSENLESDSMHVSSVHFENAFIDQIIDSVGFRLRGNTSRQSQKKSFKLSFNTFIKGRQFYGLDKLNLNGEHNDPSVIRSKLCWDFFQEIGMQGTKAAHAAVYINGNYYGLYVMIEHIDDKFLDMHFKNSSGNLWKCLWPADLTWRGSSPQDYYPWHEETRPYELKTNKSEYDYSQLVRLIRILTQTPQDQFEDSLESVIIVDEVLKYLAINILTGSWDDYWALMNNYYLYHEPGLNKFHLIPYDYDNTFGVDWFDIDWTQSNPYAFDKVNDGSRPLAENLLAIDRYRDLYTHFLDFYSTNVFALENWESRIDSIKDLIRPYVENDPYYPLDYGFTITDFDNSYTDGHYDNAHVKRGIKEFVNKRVASLKSQLSWKNGGPIVYNIGWKEEQDSIVINISAFSAAGIDSAVVLWQQGVLPVIIPYKMRFAGNSEVKPVEKNDRWQVRIPHPGPGGYGLFQVFVEDGEGESETYPRNDYIEVKIAGESKSALVINEFLARNGSIIKDEAGEYDDWLELFNSGDSTISLSGKYLSDSPDNLTRWKITDDSLFLNPGEFLLFWCDNDEEQGSLHTNFKLDGDGEFVAITNEDGVTIIDSITFSAQIQDISFGRYPDASNNWITMDPTPGKSNHTTMIKHNDLLPHQYKVITYPNPFNNSVIFQIELLQKSDIDLTIFDNNGRVVWQVKKMGASAGKQVIKWSANSKRNINLSSGLYFYQVKAVNFIKNGKIIYLK